MNHFNIFEYSMIQLGYKKTECDVRVNYISRLELMKLTRTISSKEFKEIKINLDDKDLIIHSWDYEDTIFVKFIGFDNNG